MKKRLCVMVDMPFRNLRNHICIGYLISVTCWENIVINSRVKYRVKLLPMLRCCAQEAQQLNNVSFLLQNKMKQTKKKNKIPKHSNTDLDVDYHGSC